MLLTPEDIVKHLKAYLPQVTSLFTQAPTVNSALSSGQTLTVNITGHGFSIGQDLILSSGTTRNTLTAAVLALDDTAVQFTTTDDHDLIRPSQRLDDQTLTLGGFSSVWDGEHQIIDVPNRRNFIILLPSGQTTAPPITGSEYLEGAIGLGVQQVATTPTADQFTIDITDFPAMPTNPVDNLTVITGFNIAAAADFDRAQAAYSELAPQTDVPYLFVIMTDLDVSKDRHTHNDAVSGQVAGDMALIRLLQNFSTTVFLPTQGEISGATAQTQAYGQIYDALLRVIYNFGFNEGAIAYRAASVGHGPGVYNTAYLTHVFDWQIPTAITYADGFLLDQNVAFRDIAGAFDLFGDEEAKLTFNLNLDENPL